MFSLLFRKYKGVPLVPHVGVSAAIPHAFSLLVFVLLFLCLGKSILFAQAAKGAKENRTPYEEKPLLPSFNIRLLDSTTIFNTGKIVKGKPTVFILFSPDCDHCAQLAKEVKDSADALLSTNLYMISPPMPLFEIKKFAFINGIAHKSNIVVGQDINFFFGSFFHAETVPFVVLYDKNKKLVTVLKQLKKVEELLSELRKISKAR